MELAVSSLAKSQQDEIQKLMQQQEKERLELKQLFEQQQKRLIQELLYQFNSRSGTPSSASSNTIEVGYPSSAITRSQVSKTSNSDTSTLEASIRSLSVQNKYDYTNAVSYTHLTLPTNREEEISVVAVSLKKR